MAARPSDATNVVVSAPSPKVSDWQTIAKADQDALNWTNKNQLAEKDKFEAEQNEIEGVVNPIMMKAL